MKKAKAILEGIYQIGGIDVSTPDDAASFIIKFDGEFVMIDSGASNSFPVLLKNIEELGINPNSISTIVLTHNHIDHIGAAGFFRNNFGCKILIHELDASALEEGDAMKTAASCSGMNIFPVRVDVKLFGDYKILTFGGDKLHCIHTAGHTPGSISIFIDRSGKRVLFGQDIQGPFLDVFGSDISKWKESMYKLLTLQADILCDGHFGIFWPKENVELYIRRCLKYFN